jgi:hypothetical protein
LLDRAAQWELPGFAAAPKGKRWASEEFGGGWCGFASPPSLALIRPPAALPTTCRPFTPFFVPRRTLTARAGSDEKPEELDLRLAASKAAAELLPRFSYKLKVISSDAAKSLSKGAWRGGGWVR